jgi:hypothetical protein
MSWKFCPHCGGTLPSDLPAQGALPKPEVAVGRAGQYDPARFWKSLLKRVDSWQASHPGTVPGALALAKEAFVGAAPRLASATEPMRSIVHLAFDRRITPTGSLLTSILSDGRMIDDPIKLAAMGYAVRDGKVLLVDDMPVGSVYPLLQYWGGERQHRRWHLAGPIEVDPHRNGNPLMMDENLVAFGATWQDGERMESALENLVSVLAAGVNDLPGAGDLLGLELAWL